MSKRLTRLRLFAPGPTHGPDLPALFSAAEEPIAAVRLDPRHAHATRHLEPLQHPSRSWIDSSHIALAAFQGGVPELAVDPGDAGHEAVGLDRAQNRAGLRIDLVDFPGAVLPDPERPLRPREPGIRAAAGRRDRGDHSAGLRIDLLDAILGDLKQIPAVECRAGMRGDVDR